MQTFLPLPDFRLSAEILDNRRLGKQRVEVLQILNSLDPLHPYSGWRNHPAVKMWRYHENALALYGLIVCERWIELGFRDTCHGKIFARIDPPMDRRILQQKYDLPEEGFLPPWFGDPRFHSSHRSSLLRKFPSWYGRFGWTDPPDLPYFWPVPGNS
ncbi:MAG TPA: MSMEG_6728 family protein [Synergistales bacterium]|nr:MSMEG_6728 family protein [Synergistales bacterium]